MKTTDKFVPPPQYVSVGFLKKDVEWFYCMIDECAICFTDQAEHLAAFHTSNDDELLQLKSDSVVLRAKLRALADKWQEEFPAKARELREVLGNE